MPEQVDAQTLISVYKMQRNRAQDDAAVERALRIAAEQELAALRAEMTKAPAKAKAAGKARKGA